MKANWTEKHVGTSCDKVVLAPSLNHFQNRDILQDVDGF